MISAAHSVLANRMRSILTMLGIIIGIASVILVTSVGLGFRNSLNEIFSQFGAGAMEVYMRFDSEPSRSDLLTLESAEFLSVHPNISSVSPFSAAYGTVTLRNPSETANVILYGTNQNYRAAQNVDVRLGRFLVEPDIERAAPVIVIDSLLARQVFGRTDVVGETMNVSLWLNSAEFTIVGVFRNNDPMAGMFGSSSVAFIPITCYQRMTGEENVNAILVVADDTSRLNETADEIERLLSIFHNNEDMYQVMTIMSQIEIVNTTIGLATAFVGLVAFISLAVGGIGVMNIMLVTVTERTREIGIRKSLGATDGNIQLQFLIEAIILTATGGIIGILLGYYGSFSIGTALNMPPAISLPIVIGTVLVSCLIGIIFGVYPARKAAKLDPIEALRYE
jgi:putative ABC transport system permease protein